LTEDIEKERVTLNLQKALRDKLDLLRYGSESWNQFLEKAYPILSKWRIEDREKRLKTIGE